MLILAVEAFGFSRVVADILRLTFSSFPPPPLHLASPCCRSPHLCPSPSYSTAFMVQTETFTSGTLLSGAYERISKGRDSAASALPASGESLRVLKRAPRSDVCRPTGWHGEGGTPFGMHLTVDFRAGDGVHITTHHVYRTYAG